MRILGFAVIVAAGLSCVTVMLVVAIGFAS